MTAVIPVIHYKTIRQSLANAELAARRGCHGVFLISMEGRDNLLDQAILSVSARFPELRVGANFLTLSASEALRRSLELGIDATWSDCPGVGSRGASEEALGVSRVLQAHPRHQFFGPVCRLFLGLNPYFKVPAVADAV